VKHTAVLLHQQGQCHIGCLGRITANHITGRHRYYYASWPLLSCLLARVYCTPERSVSTVEPALTVTLMKGITAT
jgi:hypothetical protein